MRSAGKSRRNAGSYSLNRSKQSGVVMIIGMIAMVALLAMTGLALDSGHMLINKTRLQNTVDAAVLNAAKVYDQTSDIALARAAVTTAINLNGDLPGQKEMKDAIADGTISVSTQFSNTLVPFAPTATPGEAWFIRVTMTNFRMPTFLVRVVGVNTLTVAASAVAGPSPGIDQNVCDLAPVMLCGDDSPTAPGHFGYSEDDIEIVKVGSGQKCDPGEDCVGPGNFQLVRLPGLTGGADLRIAAAGGYEQGCISAGDNIETEPGNTVGPTVQGFNSRFGDHKGPLKAADYPGDADSTTMPAELTLTADGTIQVGGVDYPGGSVQGDYSDYITDYACDSVTTPSNCLRRMMAVPIGNCSGTTNGQGQVPILGFACIFLLQPVVQKGNEAHVYAQFRENCNIDGTFSMTPGPGPLPTRIILYKDPNRVDS